MEEELVGQLLVPLLAQRRRHNTEYTVRLLGPELANDKAGLDGLAKPHFVGKDGASRQRRAKGKEGGIDLVRIEINSGVAEGVYELLGPVRRKTLRELVSQILGMIMRGHGEARALGIQRICTRILSTNCTQGQYVSWVMVLASAPQAPAALPQSHFA